MRFIIGMVHSLFLKQDRNFPGQFILSIKSKGDILHVLLLDLKGKVRVGDEIFNSIEEFVSLHVAGERLLKFDSQEIRLRRPILMKL